jgi:hypothetical protein
MIGTTTAPPDRSKPATTAGAAAPALEARRIRLVQLAGNPLTGQLERSRARVLSMWSIASN